MAVNLWATSPLLAKITKSGDTLIAISPGGNTTVGYSGTGRLDIDGGSTLTNLYGYFGYDAGSSGTATVTGANSKWTNSSGLSIGRYGSGILSIESEGQVSSAIIYFGEKSGSTGTVIVTGADSRLTSISSLYVGFNGSGTLNIEAGGQISSNSSQIGFGPGSTGAATVTGAGSTWTNQSSLYVGAAGNVSSGSLIVADGGLVTAGTLYASLADLQGNGTITVTQGAVLDADLIFDGSNSTSVAFGAGGTLNLTVNGGDLGVGYKGNGSLRIAGGATVSSSAGHLANRPGSAGTATVTGAGSTWANNSDLYVGGYDGCGELTVTDGGRITAWNLTIKNAQSSLRLHVSGNDMLVLGNASVAGKLTNNGTISLYADPLLAPGTYRPISEFANRPITWSGSGTLTALGGIWNNSAKTFTVSPATLLSAGETHTLGSNQRLLFADSSTGQQVGVSFGAIIGSADFSAAPMTDTDLASLSSLLPPDHSVLSAWDFSTSLTNTQAMLSFDIGRIPGEVSIWHLDDGTWSPFTPDLFTHDAQGIASFTIDSCSGYALTTAIPEPATLTLLTALATTLLPRRRHRPEGKVCPPELRF